MMECLTDPASLSNETVKNYAAQLFSMPLFDLLDQARSVHKENFNCNEIQISTLISIKTGGCPENCSYCPQSAHYKTQVIREPLMSTQAVVKAAKRAKANGSSRFCLGAAWRGPRDSDLESVIEMIREVKSLGLETCATLGLLKADQAHRLKSAGLDFYNHNIDCSPKFYNEVITTRTFDDRIDTLKRVRDANLKVCCGGIIGMGETNDDRLDLLVYLSQMSPAPESVPINKLIPVPGTPLENAPEVDSFDFIRMIAIARILMPKTYIRLSAGRDSMSQELQSLAFFAGANSIFYGEKLLTADNPVPEKDLKLFENLGLNQAGKVN